MSFSESLALSLYSPAGVLYHTLSQGFCTILIHCIERMSRFSLDQTYEVKLDLQPRKNEPGNFLSMRALWVWTGRRWTDKALRSALRRPH